MAKSKETLEKVAKFFEGRAAKHYAQGKNEEGGYHYNEAKKNYDIADKARKSGEKK